MHSEEAAGADKGGSGMMGEWFMMFVDGVPRRRRGRVLGVRDVTG